MVQGQITKIMKGAIERFSKKEQVNNTEISLFIHTKSDDCSPSYWYSVKNELKRDDNNQILNLHFNRDILDKKIDHLARGIIAAQFLSSYFKNLSESESIPEKQIYIRIDALDEELSDLNINLYNGGDHVRSMKLEEIFS